MPFSSLSLSLQVTIVPALHSFLPFVGSTSVLHFAVSHLFCSHQALTSATAPVCTCIVPLFLHGISSFLLQFIFVVSFSFRRFSFTYSTFTCPWIMASKAFRPRPQLTELATTGHTQFPGLGGTGTGAASCTCGCGAGTPDPDAVREAFVDVLRPLPRCMFLPPPLRPLTVLPRMFLPPPRPPR